MENTVELFLAQARISAVSLLSYRRDLARLFSYFHGDPEGATREELLAYFAVLEKDLSATSLARCVSVTRSYYEFLRERGYRAENPIKDVSATLFSGKGLSTFSPADFERLISYPAPGFRGMRDRAMLMLLCETGLRVTELVELDRRDLEYGAVLCGTGKRRRRLSLSPELCRTLEDYCAVADLYAVSRGRGALFITAKGLRLTRQGFWKNLKDRAIDCGIDTPLSPQTLRRSFALHLLREGKDREEVRRILGNADTSSLRGYESERRKQEYEDLSLSSKAR